MAAAAATVSSAGGILAMLHEPAEELKLHALASLNSVVHLFYPEISTSMPAIESLYEDDEFDQRQLAALVVSKMFYYLGELNDALSYALGAGPLFDVSEDSDYAQALLAKALDEYASFKTRASKAMEEEENVDPRLETIVERMLERCILDGKYQQAMGMAVECRRLDKLLFGVLIFTGLFHIASTFRINMLVTVNIVLRFFAVLLKYTRLCRIQIIWASASALCFWASLKQLRIYWTHYSLEARMMLSLHTKLLLIWWKMKIRPSF